VPSGSDIPVRANLSSGRGLRRDAQLNRVRILDAAGAAFAERGLGASVEEIASRAGVGVGTLYRRFPNKAALVDAIFEDRLDELARAADEALETAAPEGLYRFLERAVELQAENRGFCEIVAVRLRGESLLTRARARLRPLVDRLIERSQEAGEVRGDVLYEDISLLLWTTGRVVDATREVAPDFWRRQLALAFDGLRACNAGPLPCPPLTAGQHDQAMEHLARQLHLSSLD